jgi:hypothetical protein
MELKLLTKFVSAFFLLMCFPVFLSAQVVIKNQGFDGTAADNWTFAANAGSGTIVNNTSRFVSSPNSSRLRGSNNGNSDPNIVFANQLLAGFSSIKLSVAYSSDGSPDANDDLWLDLSFDNSATYSSSFRLVAGNVSTTTDNFNFGSTVSGITQAANPFVVDISTDFPAATQIRVRIRFDELSGQNNTLDSYYVDDIRLTGLISGASEIDVLGSNISITDGSTTPAAVNGTDFGSTQINFGTVFRSFTIRNDGANPLNLTGTPRVSIIGSTDFTVTTQPATPINGGSTTTFQVRFAPTSVGAKTATISIANNDPNENPYDFVIGGVGLQTFIDTDGDGVTNDIDIDDDNDGIPDTIEQDNCAANPVSNTVQKVFINETFGAGTGRTQINANIPTASTTYCYENGATVSGCNSGLPSDLNDGEYTVFNTAQIASWANQFWYRGGDHTGDTNGKMALFNAAIAPGEFYRATITGAFPNLPITYDFWAINLDRLDAPDIANRLRPNVLIEFRDLSNNLITSISTGDIAPSSIGSDQPTDWHNFTANITLGNITEFVVIFINNTPGGLGNDLALDDIVIKQTFCNSDNDVTPDVFDLDADNDGIPDIVEVGFGQLSGGKATMDLAALGPWVDANGNGLHDSIDPFVAGFNIISTDSDGILDQFDLDSDNDGLFDVDEAGYGDGDVNGDGMGDGSDSDGDGILDVFDFFVGFGNFGQPLPINSDGDTYPGTLGSIPLYDYMEVDSNNDGTFDLANQLHSALDANNDGIIDGTADVDRDGILDAFDTSTLVFGSPRDLDEKLTLEFDARNDYMEETVDLVQGSAAATFMAWVNPTDVSQNPVIMGEENIILSISSSAGLSASINGSTITSNPGITLPMNKWSHIALVYHGGTTTASLYLNGDLAGTSTSVAASINPTASNSFKVGRNPVADANYYGGLIDEVRVFDVALTADQLRRMVYQEVTYNGAAVDGAAIPLNVPGLNSANMLRYYRMDTYKDDIVDDLSTATVDIGSGGRIFNVKNIRRQTAPVPFVTGADGNWDNPATWLHDDVWDISDEANNSPWSIVDIQHNVTAKTHHGLIGLLVGSGKQLTVEDNLEMRVNWYLKLDGKMDLVGESQLIQTDGSVLEMTSSGTLERDQQGTSDQYNYNYWSFPVGVSNTTTNNNPNNISGLRDDDGNLQFINSIQPLALTTPATLSTRWMYKFVDAGNNINNWQWIAESGDVSPGEGFIMKGPASGGHNFIFEGKPNNGVISLPVSAGNIRLVGNPYASSLDANKFIADNAGVITGTLYFWEHFGGGTHILKDYEGGYATRNNTMGVAATQHPDLNPTTLSGSITPTQYVPIAQSFFVIGDVGGNIEFNNSQRTFVTEGSGNSVFTRANEPPAQMVNLQKSVVSSQEKSAQRKLLDSLSGIRPVGVEATSTVEFPRVKLNFIGPKGFFRQIGAGFPSETTTAFDNGWDALLIDKMVNDFYWKSDEDELVILAQPNLVPETVLPIVAEIENSGIIQIAVKSAENLPEGMDVILGVKENGQTTFHNLSEGMYEGEIGVGLNNDRFTVIFREQATLSLDDELLGDENFRFYFENTSKTLRLENPNGEFIDRVIGYNMLGQQIFIQEVQNSRDNTFNISLSNGVYIFKIVKPEESIIKKIIKN